MGNLCSKEEQTDNVEGNLAVNPDTKSNQGLKPAAIVKDDHNHHNDPKTIKPVEKDHTLHLPEVPPSPAIVPESPVRDATHIEDLHMDAQHTEIVKTMNSIHPDVTKRMKTLGNLDKNAFPELAKTYHSFPPIEAGSVLREKQTGATYQGQMHRGVPHGFGTLVHKDGSVTEGFFFEGKPKGVVRRYMTNDTVYEGEFSNNAANGKGIETDVTGKSIQCETWTNGVPDGIVFIKTQQGVVIYKGHLKGWKRNGQGVLYDEKLKCTSTGYFVNDVLEGHGKRVFENGNAYEGEFQKGVEHGKGAQTFIDGRIFTGNFVNGKAQGEGILTTDTGKKVKQIWKDGKRV